MIDENIVIEKLEEIKSKANGMHTSTDFKKGMAKFSDAFSEWIKKKAIEEAAKNDQTAKADAGKLQLSLVPT